MLKGMSRPPNSEKYNPSTVCNGGLIDFQDTRMMYGDANVYGTPAVANMAAYTTQASYPGYTMVQAGQQQMMPGQMMPVANQIPTQMIPVANQMPNQMMPGLMTPAQGPVVLGPPSEVCVQGVVYKLAEPTPTPNVNTAAVSKSKPPSDRAVEQRIEKKVQEYMAKNKSARPNVSSKASSNNSFIEEMNKLNASMGKKTRK